MLLTIPQGPERTTEAFLRAALPLVPEGVLRNALRRRDIKRNGVRLGPKDKLYAGETVQIFIADAYAEPALPVLYEDTHFLVIQKPAGLCTENDPYGGPSVETIAKKRFGALPCHRLDCWTAGLLALGKDEVAMAAAETALRERLWKKTYLCRVKGAPPQPQGILEGYWRKEGDGARTFSERRPGTLPVKTAYHVLKRSQTSLLEVELITGRTHQIRLEMARLGCPLVGDDRYGDRQFNREQGVSRQMLFAWRLEFHFEASAFPETEGTFVCAEPPPWAGMTAQE